MRAVLDTNVFVSMLLGGRLSVVHDAWRNGRFVLVVTDAIVSEYVDVLSRPRFKFARDAVSIVMARVQRHAEFVSPVERLRIVTADPADDKFVEAALAGNAQYIVSGDNHLLQLGAHQGIEIVTAREFLERLESV